MGKVIFLNQQSKEYHDQMGIKIKNPPDLRVVQGAKLGINDKPKRGKKAVKAKSPRKTLGQRIYENLQDQDPNGIA